MWPCVPAEHEQGHGIRLHDSSFVLQSRLVRITQYQCHVRHGARLLFVCCSQKKGGQGWKLLKDLKNPKGVDGGLYVWTKRPKKSQV